MKKIKIISFCITIISIMFSQLNVFAQTVQSNSMEILLTIGSPLMKIDKIASTEIDPGRNTCPIIVGNRTMLPIRTIVELLGGSVIWDGDEKKVTLKCEGQDIRFWIGSKNILVNNEGFKMDVEPIIENSRTYIPIKFITDYIKCNIDWDGEDKTALIKFEPSMKYNIDEYKAKSYYSSKFTKMSLNEMNLWYPSNLTYSLTDNQNIFTSDNDDIYLSVSPINDVKVLNDEVIKQFEDGLKQELKVETLVVKSTKNINVSGVDAIKKLYIIPSEKGDVILSATFYIKNNKMYVTNFISSVNGYCKNIYKSLVFENSILNK